MYLVKGGGLITGGLSGQVLRSIFAQMSCMIILLSSLEKNPQCVLGLLFMRFFLCISKSFFFLPALL